MTTPIHNDSPSSFFACFGKKEKAKNDLHIRPEFRKEFSRSERVKLEMSRPIRYNYEKQRMEVGYNSGSGVEWKPVQPETET